MNSSRKMTLDEAMDVLGYYLFDIACLYENSEVNEAMDALEQYAEKWKRGKLMCQKP